MLSQMSHVEPPRKRAKTSGDQIGAHTKSDIEQFSRKGAPGSNVKLENMEHQNQGRGNEGSMGRNASSQGTVSEPSEVNFPTSSLQGVSDGINESLRTRPRRAPSRYGEYVVNLEDIQSPENSPKPDQDCEESPSSTLIATVKNTEPRKSTTPRKAATGNADLVKELRAKMTLLKLENKKKSEEMKTVKTQNREQLRTIKTQEKDLAEKDKQLRKLTTSVTKLTARHGAPSEDDDTIRGKFRSLAAAYKTWAKEFAITSLDEIQASDLIKLQGWIVNTMSQDAADPNYGLTSSGMGKTGLSILLNALLANFVTFRFFERPFFFLENGFQGTKLKTESSLHKVWFEMNKGDTAKAHAWRSQTLSVLDPPASQVANGQVAPDIQALKDDFYSKTLRDFLEQWVDALLLKKMDEESLAKRNLKLLDIVKNAGELACSLWKQRTHMAIRKGEVSRAVFDVQSQLMRAHSSLLIDDDDMRFNGRHISAVIHPHIVAFGNDDGENYHVTKTWAEATVWFPKGREAK